MGTRSGTKEQVKSGFGRAGGWILGCAWLGLVIWGIINGLWNGCKLFGGAPSFPSLGIRDPRRGRRDLRCYCQPLEKSIPRNYACGYA
jgi:hypothetical protein